MAQAGYYDEYGNYIPAESDNGYDTAPTYPDQGTGSPQEPTGETDPNYGYAQQFFQQWLQSHPFVKNGNINQALNLYVQMRQSGQDHNNALNSAISNLRWDDPGYWNQGPQGAGDDGGTDSVGDPPPGGGGLIGPPGGGNLPPGGLISPPGPGNLPPGGGAGGGGGTGGGGGVNPPGGFFFPEFAPPVYKPIDPFRAPSMADAQSEPGYQFAMDQGRKALENSAAARGTLRTGGTFKDLFAWGNQFGEQNYSNVYNRAANTWGINNKQNMDTYDTQYRGQKDAFGAKFDASKLTFEDMYRRWRDILDANTRIATSGPGTT